MADYPTKYLFIAQTQGITQAARELNALQAAMQKVNAGSAPINLSRAQQAQSNAAAAAARAAQAQANAQNAANRAQTAGIRVTQQQTAANTQAAISIQKVAAAQSQAQAAAARAAIAQAKLANVAGGGGNATSSWQGLDGYLTAFGHRMRSALAYSVAFGAIGVTFAAIGSTVRSWVDAQIQLNSVVADTAILLGRSAEAGQQFANVQRSLAFATGQSLAEVAPSSMMAERVGQPALATSAAQWSMVAGPQLQASETVDDLRALSIQFGLSMDQINNGLLATLQNSGIAADQLFDLSASFGVFAGQLGLGETERDLREISGLFAALSNITGQTTPTLQNFVRRMADEFYDPNAALRQQLEAAGIQTVTQGPVTTTYDIFGNATQTAEEIRRPFTEIFAEIAQKGPAAIKQFSTAIDNSLGQPTQSQFILVAENWAKVDGIINDIVTSSANFADATDVASDKLQTSLDRIGIGFINFLSVIGSGDDLSSALNNIGSAFQNVYDRTIKQQEGFVDVDAYNVHSSQLGVNRNTVFNTARWTMEPVLSRASGDNAASQVLERRAKEILDVMSLPAGLPPAEATRYAEFAIQEFVKSKYFDPRDNGAAGAQSYKRFEANGLNMVQALRYADPGISDADLLARFDNILSEMEKRALRPWSFQDPSGLATFPSSAISTGPLPSPWMSQAQGLRNMMIQDPRLIQSLGSPFDMKQISLPKDVTPEGFDKAYDEVSAILVDRFGPAISEAAVEAMAFSDEASGIVVSIGAYNTEIAQSTIRWLQATGKNEAAADVLTSGFYNLTSAAAAAAGGLSAILSRGSIDLPAGMTAAEYKARYNQLAGDLRTMFPGQELSDQDVKPYIFRNEDTGVLTGEGANLDPLIKAQLDNQLALEQAANAKALAEQKDYQSKALAAQEAYQNKMLGNWNGMINDLLKPSAVTGTDLFYNSKTGQYNDNWDEPVRQMKADINNALAGKPLEYGYGGLGQYMNMDAINAAMGMDQASKEAILRSEEAGVSERFYNMELPWEAYSGNTDSIIANAQAWIAGKQQKNANMANVQQLLIDAGLGPDAEGFVKAMEEPPILRQLFGGKTSDEISSTVTEAVTPDLGKAIGDQVAKVTWAAVISTSIANDVTNNYEMIVAAGRAIGKPLAEGSAGVLAAAIIPLVIAAIIESGVTP